MTGIAFFLVALASYYPLDNSYTAFTLPHQSTRNFCGEIGAFISSVVIFYLGFTAFFLPIPLVLWGISLLGQSKSFNLGRLAFWCLATSLITIAVGYFLEVGVPIVHVADYALLSNGVWGHTIYSWGTRKFGTTGGQILATLILGSGVLLFVQRRILAAAILFFPLKIHRLLMRCHHLLIGAVLDLKGRFKRAKPVSARNLEIGMGLAPMERTAEELQRVQAAEGLFFKSQDGSQNFQGEAEEKVVSSVITNTLREFGINGEVVGILHGPTITIYEFQHRTGIKQSKVITLADDLALALQVESVLISPVTNKRALGIQVPRKKRATVLLGDLISTPMFKSASSPLTYAIGKSGNGDPVFIALNELPHLLIAGATGSGKSVGINTIISSILMKAHPSEVQMILVDPKLLELSIYNGIPHLQRPVVTSVKDAVDALKWIVEEMERRYAQIQKRHGRNIQSYNDALIEEYHAGNANALNARLPYILVVIDELADLMLSAPKEIEALIQKIAQKSRASGIHLVLATQRPSVDILTGKIKANLPARMAFQVASRHDSRTILDQGGAEKLLGRGDLLLQLAGKKTMRVQGAYVSDREIQHLVEYLKATKISA